MISNTTKKTALEWLFFRNPGSIEWQEARGQQELVESSQLPAKLSSGKSAADKYKELGVKVIGKTKGDDLFLDVALPDGWAIKPTDHSMWSNLINAEGKEVASIFYKAAFYDRGAFINFPSN